MPMIRLGIGLKYLIQIVLHKHFTILTVYLSFIYMKFIF